MVLSFVLLLGLNLLAVSAQPKLGLVDFVNEGLSIEDSKLILPALRQEFQWQSVYEVLREEEVELLKLDIDPLQVSAREEFERQKQKITGLKEQVRQAKLFYAESRFQESQSVLENTWYTAAANSLAVEPELAQEILSYLAANLYFQDQQEMAREVLGSLHIVFPEYSLDATKFPPALLSISTEIKKSDISVKELRVNANVSGFQVRLFGKQIGDSGPTNYAEIRLPENSSLFAAASLVLEKNGYAPVLLPISNLSAEVQFQRYRKEKLETEKLFGVLGRLSPPPELLKFMKERRIDVVLLLNASKNFNSEWILRGQLFRAANGDRTPVVESVGMKLPETSKRLVKRLLFYVSPQGEITEPNQINFIERTETPKALYQKWWFWTLVGVGAAGLGLGSYYIFKPEDEVRFHVRQGG